MDIYDDFTGVWTVAQLTEERAFGWMSSATVGSRAFFGGGSLLPGGVSDRVDIYDALTQTWSTETLSVPRFAVAMTAIGDRVLFAGGGGTTPPCQRKG